MADDRHQAWEWLEEMGFVMSKGQPVEAESPELLAKLHWLLHEEAGLMPKKKEPDARAT